MAFRKVRLKLPDHSISLIFGIKIIHQISETATFIFAMFGCLNGFTGVIF